MTILLIRLLIFCATAACQAAAVTNEKRTSIDKKAHTLEKLVQEAALHIRASNSIEDYYHHQRHKERNLKKKNRNSKAKVGKRSKRNPFDPKDECQECHEELAQCKADLKIANHTDSGSLYVQMANKCKLSRVGGMYTLSSSDMFDETWAFKDRPIRYETTMTTQDFFNDFDKIFSEDTGGFPNGAITFVSEDDLTEFNGPLVTVMIKASVMERNDETGMILYTYELKQEGTQASIIPLDDFFDNEDEVEYADCSLFIDSGDPSGGGDNDLWSLLDKYVIPDFNDYTIDYNMIYGSGSFKTVYKATLKNGESGAVGRQVVTHYASQNGYPPLGDNETSWDKVMAEMNVEFVIQDKLETCPNIARVFAHGIESIETKEFFYNFMPASTGGDLSSEDWPCGALAGSSPPCPSRSRITMLHAFRKISSALACMHNLGFAHMDIKPAQFLAVTPERNDFELNDFGYAISMVDGIGLELTQMPYLWDPYGDPTGTYIGNINSFIGNGFTIGTPAFMAPEVSRPFCYDYGQSDGSPVVISGLPNFDNRAFFPLPTDVWSLCVAFGNIVNGGFELRFRSINENETCSHWAKEAQDFVDNYFEANFEEWSDLGGILKGCLRIDPSERPTMQELSESFESLGYFPPFKSSSGEVGNDSFGISFGYTGSYTAKPYGLVEAQEFSGTFSDSDFKSPPNLYIKALTINVPEDTVLLRVKLPSNPDLKKSFYMADPSGASQFINKAQEDFLFPVIVS